MNSTRQRFVLMCLVLAAMLLCSLAAHADETLANRADAIVRQLQRDQDFDAAQTDLDALLDEVLAFQDASNKQVFRDVVAARRLVQQFAHVKMSDRFELLEYVRRHEELARAMAFAVDPLRDDLLDVYDLLWRLKTQRPELVPKYPNLTAAICIVHDKRLSRRINENRAYAPDPLAIFDYYVANESRMIFGIRDVPVELLVYIVDTTASIEEMTWALDKYAGDQAVGARFFDIHYDYEHFREGKPKKVTQLGWNLPNILEHGGVCADQAYFAVSVGKAIGVPTTYTRGRSSTVSHAWVGFLQSDGKRAWWNFNAGRYPEYQGVRGIVQDPQTRHIIADSSVSLLADLIHASTLDRQFAAAVTDAVQRLRQLQDSGAEWPPTLQSEPLRPQRQTDVEAQLDLLEAALRACPGYAPAWISVRDLAQSGALTLDQKKKWAQVLHRLCAERYPEFELAILEPMIETVEDVNEQNALWNAAFNSMGRRVDLAAEVRMAQGKMWKQAGQPQKSGRCYEDVIVRYANAGPFIVRALIEAEKILIEHGEQRRIVALYEQAWRRINRPGDMGAVFARQSNWYRVGKMYADRLTKAGQTQQAEQVRRTIGVR